MGKYVVAIDAGHHPNSSNGGTQGYKEGVGMMKLAHVLFEELRKYQDITPVMVRTDTDDKNPDNNVSLTERSRRAADAKAFVVLSLHSNAGGGEGTEVFYSVKNPGDKSAAADLSRNVAAALGVKDRGAKMRGYPYKPGTDYYAIIRESVKRGVKHAFIIEHAFHDNEKEERLLMDPKKLDAVAKVEAKTIAKWLSVKEHPTQQPKPTEPKEMDNTPSRWAAGSVEKAINKKVLIGDQNGNFMLNSQVTREELFVFLDRLGLLE